MKKILILEDNSATLEQLTAIVQEVDSRNEVYPFDNVKDALDEEYAAYDDIVISVTVVGN